jgi:hypothetical protein
MLRNVLAVLMLAAVASTSHIEGQDRWSISIVLPRVVGGQLSGFDPEWEGKFYNDYEFVGLLGQEIGATVVSGAFDTVLHLGRYVDGTFESLASNDDVETGSTNSVVVAPLPADGVYVLRVTSFDGATGAYVLMAMSDDERPFVDPVPLEVGDSLSANITLADAVNPGMNRHFDTYTIEAAAGQRLVVTMTSEGFDNTLYLFRWGDLLEGRDIDGTISTIDFTITESDIYTIEAGAATDDATGPYWLRVSDAASVEPQPGTATSADAQPSGIALEMAAYREIDIPHSLSGLLDDLEDRLFEDFVFNGPAGLSIVAEMRSSEFESLLHLGRVVNGRLEIIASSDDDGTSSNARLAASLPASGQYVLRATTPDSVAYGQYFLYLGADGDDFSFPPTPISVGDVVEGLIMFGDPVFVMGDDDYHFDEYALDVVAGQRLMMAVTADAFESVIEVWRANGDDREQVNMGFPSPPGGPGSTTALSYRFDEGGRYVLRVYPGAFAEVLGPYTLAVLPD